MTHERNLDQPIALRYDQFASPAVSNTLIRAARIATALCFCISIVITPLSVVAQGVDSGWVAVQQSVADLTRQGRTTEAEKLLQAHILAAQTQNEVSEGLAEALDTQATLLYGKGRLAEAERNYKQSIAVWEGLPDTKPRIGLTLSNYASLRLAQGRPSDAEKLYRRAEHILVERHGVDSPEVAFVLSGIADMYWATRRYQEASECAERARLLLENAGRDEEFRAVLFLLAEVAWKRGREADAEPLLRPAAEAWGRALGTHNATYASALLALARLRSRQDSKEADQVFHRALGILSVEHGPDHVFTATALHLYEEHLKTDGQKKERRPEAILSGHSRANALGFTRDVATFR